MPASRTWASVAAAAPPRAPADAAASSRCLEDFIDAKAPLLDPPQRAHRNAVVSALEALLLEMEVGVRAARRVDPALASASVLLSGSSQLGVAQRDDDIDAVVVAPLALFSREDFFDESEAGFVGRLRAHPDVSRVFCVSSALVPLVNVVWSGVELDILFAGLRTMPASLADEHLLNDNILVGMDEASILSINGPRVTRLIAKLVSDCFATFLIVLRCLRFYAKRRAIYSNRIGLLGGINCALLAAHGCKLHPKASPSTVLHAVFNLVATWPWPNPLILVAPHEGPGLPVRQWNVVNGRDDKMPIITPCYPNTNSSFSVTLCTLATLKKEFARGAMETAHVLSLTENALSAASWDVLFAPSNFFLECEYFSVVEVSAGDPEAMRKFSGYVGSKLRWLLLALERLGVRDAHPYPDVFEDQEKQVKRWFIGFPQHVHGVLAASSDFTYSMRKWPEKRSGNVFVYTLSRAEISKRYPGLHLADSVSGGTQLLVRAPLQPAAPVLPTSSLPGATVEKVPKPLPPQDEKRARVLDVM